LAAALVATEARAAPQDGGKGRKRGRDKPQDDEDVPDRDPVEGKGAGKGLHGGRRGSPLASTDYGIAVVIAR
jgi:hypothetical protein